jgi:hypothetical protein
MVVLTETAHQILHWLAEFFAAARSRFRVSASNKSPDFLLWRHSPEAFVNNEPLSSARLKASHALMMSFLVTALQLASSKFQLLDVERARRASAHCDVRLPEGVSDAPNRSKSWPPS